MAATDVLWIDDARMKQVSRDVDTLDESVKALVARMFAVIDDMQDTGLAAIQLGVALRIVAIDMADEHGARQRLALINPHITWSSPQTTSHLELCSSIPGHPMPAQRAQRIKVTFLDMAGEQRELDAGGAFAVCLQHEIEHLDGRSLLDSLSELKRNRLKTQLAKQRRRRSPHE
ncbi:peptide deformylase [Affinibrenneria salicis]|uniref:Peptide deformylase n=1 Tax=Affinibrenneria salicis TaxID=2590031 RepID=A0A5J5FYS9_9GAMM|nr:peptide deformylase [Affinibrenneria salicis]KAA8998928.1 peptide deformylase [Affinibrenneria salicis]